MYCRVKLDSYIPLFRSVALNASITEPLVCRSRVVAYISWLRFQVHVTRPGKKIPRRRGSWSDSSRFLSPCSSHSHNVFSAIYFIAENNTIIELNEATALEFLGLGKPFIPLKLPYNTRYRICFNFHSLRDGRFFEKRRRELVMFRAERNWFRRVCRSCLVTGNFDHLVASIYNGRYSEQVHRPRRAKLSAANIAWKRKLEVDGTWLPSLVTLE